MSAQGHASTGQLKIDNNAMFLFAVFVLIGILIAGSWRDDLQYNMMFLIALSLTCSIVFAFLPFSAEVGLDGWLRASGTAAIFAVCLWQTVPFAKDMLKADHDRQQKVLEKQLAQVDLAEKDKLIAEKDKQLGELRVALEKAKSPQQGNSPQLDLVRQNLVSMSATTSNISKALAEAQNFTRAAQSNYSDSRTCSLRASQALEGFSVALSGLDALSSSLGTATAVLSKAP
jgi:hypothetical protein